MDPDVESIVVDADVALNSDRHYFYLSTTRGHNSFPNFGPLFSLEEGHTRIFGILLQPPSIL